MNLDTEKRRELRMINDEDRHMLYIFHKGEYAKFPHTAVDHMVPKDMNPLKALFDKMFTEAPSYVVIAPAVEATPQRGRPKAQVGGPTHHVFDTGPGKTHD